jgi:hypothetical protein
MNHPKRTVLLLLCLMSAGAWAGEYSDESMTLVVPDGFEGPVEQRPGPGALTVGYSKPTPNSTSGTLLQVTTYDAGSQEGPLPEDQRGAITEQYLLQFLGGVERARTAFGKSPVEKLRLGGIPAARIRWQGEARGLQMSGVMYCVIVGTRVISFHTQALADAPPGNMSEAMRAIEAVKFRQPAKP